MQTGFWRVTGSTRVQNLTVKSICAFNSTPSGNKLIGIHDRMDMEFASKFNGTMVVKSQLFKLVKGILNIAGPTNTQTVSNLARATTCSRMQKEKNNFTSSKDTPRIN
eukprot:1159688-Pelagomonas_calceolata.AAC.1